jgi:hypothetical protein
MKTHRREIESLSRLYTSPLNIDSKIKEEVNEGDTAWRIF